MSFGGFIKKRGLRIKMRNYDPYKKTILFFASLVNIVLMSLVFMYVWFHYYAATMFVATFYRKGHYAMIGLYALILFFFSTMYGSMKIGQYRRLEVMLSQYLSLVFCNMPFGIRNSKSHVYDCCNGSRDDSFHDMELCDNPFLQQNFPAVEDFAYIW